MTIWILADDLTGANDTALAFCQAGFQAWVQPDFTQMPGFLTNPFATNSLEKPQAWALNLNTREVPADDRLTLHTCVSQALSHCQQAANSLMPQVYFKMDSTLRGPWAQTLGLLLDTSEADIAAFIAPAFPEQGRIVRHGQLWLHGQVLQLSNISPDLNQHLLATGIAPGQITHWPKALLAQSIETVLSHWQAEWQQGVRYWIPDIEASEDFVQLVQLIQRIMQLKAIAVLPVGSAGLANVWAQACFHRFFQPERMNEASSATKPPDDNAKLQEAKLPVLVISGSKTALTQQQLAHTAKTLGIQPFLQPFGASQNTSVEAPFEATLAAIVGVLKSHGVAIVASVLEDTDILPGLSAAECALQDQHLARLAQAVYTQQPYHCIVCGGQTAMALAQQQKVCGFQVLGAVEPAIPLLQPMSRNTALSSSSNGTRWVSKSGNFGTPETLLKAIEVLT